MPIPDFQTIMLPLLQVLGDGSEHTFRKNIELLSTYFDLTDEERTELLPSGRQPTFNNRVGWAGTYMKKARLIESPKRGLMRITPRGQQVLASAPAKIDVKFLEQFEEFLEFRSKSNSTDKEATNKIEETATSDTPEEVLEGAYQTLRNSLVDEILTSLKECSSGFFEKLVVDVLVKMGYGGSRREAGHAIGGSGDDGVDGIINEDRLGLDSIYIQAKRWKENVIGRPEVQKFAGALQGHRARKGIFITTSSFTKEAREYVSRIDSKIVLIDGDRLAGLMIDHNVGVTLEATYEVKRVDSDYFME